jgi:hypothetical protein
MLDRIEDMILPAQGDQRCRGHCHFVTGSLRGQAATTQV